MVVVVSSADMTARSVLDDFSLELETGVGTSNDFELSLADARIGGGDAVWVPGTEFGGFVEEDCPKSGPYGDSVSYRGRTWRGVLDGYVTRPPQGRSHLSVSGSAKACIKALMSNAGAGSPFSVADGDEAAVSYTVPRFATLHDAIDGMLASAGLALGIRAVSGTVEVFARKPSTVDETQGVGFEAVRGFRPVNHLVVLGKGEMQEREVIDLYADADGNVSDTQTLFGTDHRAEVYELSSEEGEELLADGRKKLKEYQADRDKVTLVEPSAGNVSIGDVLHATSAKFGLRASAAVTGLVVEASGAFASVRTKTGGKSSAKSYE